MCECHNYISNGLGDMWRTDKCTYFSSIDNIPHLVKERIIIHSRQGFVKYVKHHLLQSSRETCKISNCYTCMNNNIIVNGYNHQLFTDIEIT